MPRLSGARGLDEAPRIAQRAMSNGIGAAGPSEDPVAKFAFEKIGGIETKRPAATASLLFVPVGCFQQRHHLQSRRPWDALRDPQQRRTVTVILGLHDRDGPGETLRPLCGLADF